MAYSSIEVSFSKVTLGCIKLTAKTNQDSHEASISLRWMEIVQMVSRQDQLYLFSPECLIVLLCQSSLDSRESPLVLNIQCQKVKIGVLFIHNSEWYSIVQQTVTEMIV